MSRLLSDRAEKTDQVVLLSSSLEDPTKSPPGLYRVGLAAICLSIFVFFLFLVFAYYWRSSHPPYWDPIPLPRTLWISTALILASSITLEIGRRLFRKGEWRVASRLLLATASLGVAFLAAQVTAWRQLVAGGAYLAQNPHSSFFYLFTGLHAAHLLGGLVVLFVILLGRSKRREMVDVGTYYWHFLGLLWVALFIVLRTR
jgi:cytochrome c oxidase subunit 3